ncbi:unnamed protein product [Moneuplotes crassus]|uniref:Uncharacterized protein n=1 Tax=Euplotes crassus TaxID=5936 RepID=A0AAD1Y0Q3_EUPCR|nr:unnamed protein product [Moneuplotes crassus]
MSKAVETQKSGFTFASRAEMELRYLKTLSKNFLYNCLEKCYHTDDLNYYKSFQDLSCEDTCHSTYTSRTLPLENPNLALWEDQKNKCLSESISPVKYQTRDLTQFEKCLGDYTDKVQNVIKEMKGIWLEDLK